MRRWIVGPEGKSRGRRRGLAARLMDVASYDEEGARRSTRRSRRRGRCRPTAGCSGWPKAIRSGRSRRCSPRCAARSTRGPRRRRPATGSRPSWPSPTARWSRAAAARGGARGAAKPLAALARRLEAVLEDAPDWLDSAGAGAGRGRDQRARLAARDARARGSRCSAGSAASADPDFVDWLAIERVEGREYDVGLHRRWLDPTKPLAEAVLEAGARRAGHLGDAARRRGLGRRRGAHRRAHCRRRRAISRRTARSIMPRNAKC
jgi:ATP-dependent DNA helicase DinG